MNLFRESPILIYNAWNKCYTYVHTFGIIGQEGLKMNKDYSMSIRVTEEELEKLKQAARLEAYASYSEFVRRTALLEASRVIEKNNKGEDTIGEK